jgi:hypothetical protein
MNRRGLFKRGMLSNQMLATRAALVWRGPDFRKSV